MLLFQLALAFIVFAFILLIIRTSHLNQRVQATEDCLVECVTKDRLRDLVVAHIKQSLELEPLDE